MIRSLHVVYEITLILTFHPMNNLIHIKTSKQKPTAEYIDRIFLFCKSVLFYKIILVWESYFSGRQLSNNLNLYF